MPKNWLKSGWRRYSLRSLFVLMTVCCLLLGGWSVYVNPYRVQLRSLAVVNRLQGLSQARDAAGPMWQRWLVTRLLGTNAFVHVTVVDLTQRSIDDDALFALTGLTHLESLALDRTQISDRGLGALRSMTSLQHVSLMYTSITDQGIRILRSLPKLRSIHLTGTKVSDAAIADLAAQQEMTELWIRWTQISAAGAERLAAALPNCAVHYHALARP